MICAGFEGRLGGAADGEAQLRRCTGAAKGTEATAAFVQDGFEESTLGLVPKGWPVGAQQELLVLQRGFGLPAQDRMSALTGRR